MTRYRFVRQEHDSTRQFCFMLLLGDWKKNCSYSCLLKHELLNLKTQDNKQTLVEGNQQTNNFEDLSPFSFDVGRAVRMFSCCYLRMSYVIRKIIIK